YRARRYDQALAQFQRALELDPGYIPALARIADTYDQLGKYYEALAAISRYQQSAGDTKVGWSPLARVYAHMGKRDEARQILRKVEKNFMGPGVYWKVAGIYSALGDRDRAISALEEGAQNRSFLAFIFRDPELDPIRSDPRFQELLRRARLPS